MTTLPLNEDIMLLIKCILSSFDVTDVNVGRRFFRYFELSTPTHKTSEGSRAKSVYKVPT